MRFWKRLRTWTLVACVGVAAAPRPAMAEEVTTGSVAAARKHFEKARTYYGQGAYREAIAELEAAHALDPSAKDLVFNLGVVHEKLQDIDEALKWFRVYTTMDLVPQERERADAYIKRLEGAKKEIEEKQAAEQAAQQQTKPSLPPPEQTLQPPARAPFLPPAPARAPLPPERPAPIPPPPPPAAGRVDALTVTAGTLCAGGIGFGVFFAVKAFDDQPTGFVTSSSAGHSYDDLVNRRSTAHTDRILADSGFAVALVSGLAASYLYFGRTRSAPTRAAAPSTVTLAPLPGGGTFFLKGHF